VLLALLVVAACGAMQYTPAEYHATLKALAEKPMELLKEKFTTLEVNPLASSICNATYFSSILPGGGVLGIGQNGACPCFDFNLGALTACYSGFCNNLDACPSLFDLIPAGAPVGEYCPIDSITTNCGNGCFGKVIAPLNGIEQCVINWALGTLNNLCSFLASNTGGAITEQECLQSEAGFSTSFTGSSNFAEITNNFNELCYEQPATGQLCYGWLMGAYGGSESDWSSCSYLQAMGCCASSIKTQLKAFNASTAPCASNFFGAGDYFIFKSALSTCGLSSTPACPAPGQSVKYVLGKWALAGISYSAFFGLDVTNRWAFYTALRNDIAVNLGLTTAQTVWVSIANITVTSTAGEIVLTFTVRADTDANTATVQATVTAFLAGTGTVTFSNTNTFITANAGLSLGSGSSGVTVDRAGSSAATQTQSGASSDAATRTVSMVMVLFAIVVAMFRF